jgi:hypothetical protein
MRHSGVLRAVMALTAACALAGCAAPATISTSAGTPAAGSTPKDAAKTAARIGSTIDLTGEGSGEKMAVRLVKIMKHARGTEFSSAGRGKVFLAAQFRLTDIGSAAYSDAPDNSAVAVDNQGQSYQTGIDTVAGCQSFGGTENIAPGDSGLGCVVFTVPRHAKITTIQFTLDSGMASDTGQWRASR